MSSIPPDVEFDPRGLAALDLEPKQRAEYVRGGEREPISTLVRRLVYRRDNWTCQRCGRWAFAEDERRQSGALHLDHIVPWSAGGSDRTDNLRTLCGPCNYDRSNFVGRSDEPAMPIVGICVPCHPRIEPTAFKPDTAFDVYCACRHHIGWAIPGWSIL